MIGERTAVRADADGELIGEGGPIELRCPPRSVSGATLPESPIAKLWPIASSGAPPDFRRSGGFAGAPSGSLRVVSDFPSGKNQGESPICTRQSGA